MNLPIPVYLLSGFLGSGKTTLLNRLLQEAESNGLRPAVIMNEIGDVNLDGLQVGGEVPMTEMLSGCICCTVRGDLGLEILKLADEHRPDVIYIESTGVANPIEILDGVTEASLLLRAELKGITTVMDAAQLLEQLRKGKGQTYRLMRDQLRCASVIILNKIDLVNDPERQELREQIREWNPYAPVQETIRCDFDLRVLDSLALPQTEERHSADCACSHDASEPCTHSADPHHTHSHVMVYTHYLDKPVDSHRFEEMMGTLPEGVYRAKGILRFTDTSSRFMFQYAYRQVDFMKIMPQREVPDVAVFIGEHFDPDVLKKKLEQLEQEP